MAWRRSAPLLPLASGRRGRPGPPSATSPSPRRNCASPEHNPQTGRPVDSVSELVPLLPDELRRNFTFVYDSRSPFKAAITPQLPRVILFTDDGRRW